MLSDASGALVIKPCTSAEISFYESARTEHPDFAAIMPEFMGTLTLSGQQLSAPATSTPEVVVAPAPDSVPAAHGKKLETDVSLVLENIVDGFKKPNVLDLKLGAQLWDDKAPPEKRARLDKVAAESTSSSLGFRVAGMLLWLGPQASLEDSTVDTNGYKKFGKFYGRNFSDQDVSSAFKEFLFVERAGVSRDLGMILARRFLREVKNIQAVLEREESRMYGASILMVYEGDGSALVIALEEEKTLEAAVPEDLDHEDDEDEPERLKILDMKLIDFAHASWTPGQGSDENALQGVRSIVKILEELVSS